MSKTDATVLKDGQLAIATFEQSGTLISGASAIDTTCLLQTEDGVQQCVKTFPLGEGGGGGTSDYSDLSNKPQINGTTLSGNKSSSDLGVADTSLSNLTAAGKEVAGTMSMPSDVMVDLTPVQGQLMTMPSDGYLTIYAQGSADIFVSLKPSTATSIDAESLITLRMNSSSGYPRAFIPVGKGQKIFCAAGAAPITGMRFCYANGSEPQQ